MEWNAGERPDIKFIFIVDMAGCVATRQWLGYVSFGDKSK